MEDEAVLEYRLQEWHEVGASWLCGQGSRSCRRCQHTVMVEVAGLLTGLMRR